MRELRIQGGDVLSYAAISSPVGPVWVAVGQRGVVAISVGVDEVQFWHEISIRGEARPQPEALVDATTQLEEYFQGRRRVFDLAVDLSSCTGFQQTVLEAVRSVPYGAVRSYRDIAWMVGKPGAARAVGGAVATNPVSLVIPCHRIIRSDGTPGEYAHRSMGSRGVELKVALLSLEGVEFGSPSPTG